MIDVPSWIQVFVLVGICTLLVVVPLRVLYAMTKESRKRSSRLEDLAERLKGRFEKVELARTFLGPSRIEIRHDGRPASIAQTNDEEILVRVEPKIAPKFHLIARTHRRFSPPVAFLAESLKFLPRVKTYDPLIDDGIAVYANPIFGGYLRVAALDGIPGEGKPQGLAESLVVLRRLPGIRSFELRMSPSGGFRIAFRLESEELVYRPDEMESAVHHAFRIYDVLVMY